MLASLALGLLGAVALCWEALAAGSRRIVGAPDAETWSFLWGHAWMRRSLLEEGRFPLHTTWIDFPDGGTLWLKDSLSAFFLLPLNLLAGPESAYDASVVLHLAGACVAATLFARALGAGWLASLAAGPLHAFMPHTLGEAYNGNIEAISTAFTPLWGWALLRVVQRPGWASVAAAALTLPLLVWANQYWTIAMALVSPLLLGLALWQETEGRARRLGWVVLAVALGTVLSLPILLGLRANLVATDSLTFFDDARILLQEPYLTDLRHYLQPLAPLGDGPGTTLQDIAYPGWLLVLLCLLAPLARPRSPWAWLLPALGLAFLVLSIGPAASWNGTLLRTAGGSPVWLPWAYLISDTPVLESMTLPHRLAVPAGAFFAAGAALTLDRLAQRGRSGAAIALGLALLAAAEIALVPGYRLPLRTSRLDRPAHALLLAEAPGDGAVLNLPQRTGLNKARVLLWYQVLHGRPTSQTLRHGGASSAGESVPFVKAAWRWERWLARGWRPDQLQPPRDDSTEALERVGFDYVVIHGRLFDDLAHGDAQVHEALVKRWSSLVLPALGPGVVLPDGTVVLAVEEAHREALADQAEARWGEAVLRVEQPAEVVVHLEQ